MNNRIKAFLLLAIVGAGTISFQGIDKTEKPEEIIIKKEKAQLDKWTNRNVWGYLDLMAKDVTYFDNETKVKLIGFEAVKKYIAPFDGKNYAYSYKMENVGVVVSNDIGVLSFNFYSFNEKGDTTSKWNTTEVYRLVENDWKIIHGHWSLAK